MTVLTDQQAAGLLRDAGFLPFTLATMVAIGHAESGLNTDATNHNTNGSTDYGWLQINSSHHYDSAKLISDPAYNAAAAHAIWSTQGLGAWSSYKSGAYRQFLAQGQQGAANPNSSGIGGAGSGGTLDQAGKGPLDTLLGLASGPIDAAESVGQGIANIGKTLTGFLSVLLRTAEWLGNSHNWIRILEVIGGGALIAVGVHALATTGGQNPLADAARGVQSTVKNVKAAAQDAGESAALAAA